MNHAEIVDRVFAREARSADTYEILVILFGALGLSRLYLGQVGLAVARVEVVLAALVALGTGLMLMSLPFLLVGAAFAALSLALWIRDWTTVDRQVEAYHAGLEAKVLARIEEIGY